MSKQIVLVFLFIGGFITAVASLQSCKKASFTPIFTNEPEIITTLKIEFKDAATGQILTYYYRDMDGDSINAPIQLDTIRLNANATYFTSIKFLDESNPDAVANVTHEIKSEAVNHLVCLNASANTFIIRTDNDGTFPLGLESKWMNGLASTGDFTVSLKHQAGFKNGSCEIGETDLEVVFPMAIM
ncbi:MAG: hypothetical protein ACKVQB_03930 [Bacteroidia bacterium]